MSDTLCNLLTAFGGDKKIELRGRRDLSSIAELKGGAFLAAASAVFHGQVQWPKMESRGGLEMAASGLV